MSVRTTIEDETAKICKYNKKMPTIAHVLNEDLSRKSSKNRSPLHRMHHQQIENVSHRTKILPTPGQSFADTQHRGRRQCAIYSYTL